MKLLNLVFFRNINQFSTPIFMKNKIALNLFLAILAGHSFDQKINVAKLDSLFQILETNNKFMGSIAVSQNGALFFRNPL